MIKIMDYQPELLDPEPVVVIDLFPETLDHLTKLLSSLTEPEWNAATICAGWSVKDVALHLLGVEIGNISFRRDLHRLGRSISSWDELVKKINSWNQEWVAVSRRISTPLLIELIAFLGQRANDYFCSLDPFEMGGPISWAGPEPKPIWLDIAREYTERWHHQQHIRDAINKPGLQDPKYLGPVLQTFSWALPYSYRHVSEPDGNSITLSITGEAGGQWTLLHEKGGWGFYLGTTMHPDAEITMDEDTAWRFFTRGIGEDRARKLINITGKINLAEPIFEMVSIIA